MKTNLKNNISVVTEAFISQLLHFECKWEIDPYWNVIFQVSANKWCELHVSKYEGVFYVNESISGLSLEIEPSKARVEKGRKIFAPNYDSYSDIKEWIPILNAAIQWLKKAEKNWTATYKSLLEQFPLKYRKGIVPASVVAHYFPEFKHLQKHLGIRNTKKMISLVENGKLKGYDTGVVETLTASQYFEYCKLAYIAVGKAKQVENGKELYERFADGRHEGLLEIDPDSEKEFADWIDEIHPKRERGGHPWEILRGGNTSNIQLRVSRPNSFDKKGFKIEISPTGLSRLAESVKIFLSIFKTGKPIAIPNPETIREQLLLQDNIGVLPDHYSLHRGNQLFEESENVHGVIQLYHLRKHAAKIKPFITWEPLPLMPLKSLP